jgi:hypothetical protein
MIKKFANATLQEPSLTAAEWGTLYGNVPAGVKTASIAKIANEQSRYLLSHCTIMSSVMCEAAPFDYLIKPECSHLVNSNHDAWENSVLKMSYKTFIGGFNFVEHFQNRKAVKGHIFDTVLRKIHITPETWVYFVDLLVGTSLEHTALCMEIRSGKKKYLSMGCVTDLVICSYCGARVTDQETYCVHLQRMKGDSPTRMEFPGASRSFAAMPRCPAAV